MNNQPPPVLSIVIVIVQDRACLMRAMGALHPQAHPTEIEVIIPVDDSRQDVLDLAAEFPEIHFERVQGKHTFAELRSAAVHQARGDIIAITEDHCIPNPNWCNQIITAHQRPVAAVGGSVEKKHPDTLLNWAVYFADYLRYMNPIGEGATNSLTDLNVSYKRAHLEKIAEIWQVEFHENQVNEALQKDMLWLLPEMMVSQQREFSLRQALIDRYAFGRLFASTRLENTPASRRLIFSAFAVLVPFLQVIRTTRLIIQKKRFLGKYCIAFPFLFLLCTFWGIGEFLGYLTGKPATMLDNSAQPS